MKAIERKFLVRDLGWRRSEGVVYRQGEVVTGDPRYYNSNLARNPDSKWAS